MLKLKYSVSCILPGSSVNGREKHTLPASSCRCSGSTHLSHDVGLTARVSVALQKAGLPQASRAAHGVVQGVADAQAMLEVHRQLSQALPGNGNQGDERFDKVREGLTSYNASKRHILKLKQRSSLPVLESGRVFVSRLISTTNWDTRNQVRH